MCDAVEGTQRRQRVTSCPPDGAANESCGTPASSNSTARMTRMPTSGAWLLPLPSAVRWRRSAKGEQADANKELAGGAGVNNTLQRARQEKPPHTIPYSPRHAAAKER